MGPIMWRRAGLKAQAPREANRRARKGERRRESSHARAAGAVALAREPRDRITCRPCSGAGAPAWHHFSQGRSRSPLRHFRTSAGGRACAAGEAEPSPVSLGDRPPSARLPLRAPLRMAICNVLEGICATATLRCLFATALRRTRQRSDETMGPKARVVTHVGGQASNASVQGRTPDNVVDEETDCERREVMQTGHAYRDARNGASQLSQSS